jgi:hypothetical protein
MPKGRLYTWEDMARVGRQSPETRPGRKLACRLSVYVEAISNRRSKDSSCAHKGLVTNWLHRNTMAGFAPNLLQNIRNGHQARQAIGLTGQARACLINADH